jgi:hypothetical protein
MEEWFDNHYSFRFEDPALIDAAWHRHVVDLASLLADFRRDGGSMLTATRTALRALCKDYYTRLSRLADLPRPALRRGNPDDDPPDHGGTPLRVGNPCTLPEYMSTYHFCEATHDSILLPDEAHGRVSEEEMSSGCRWARGILASSADMYAFHPETRDKPTRRMPTKTMSTPADTTPGNHAIITSPSDMLARFGIADAATLRAMSKLARGVGRMPAGLTERTLPGSYIAATSRRRAISSRAGVVKDPARGYQKGEVWSGDWSPDMGTGLGNANYVMMFFELSSAYAHFVVAKNKSSASFIIALADLRAWVSRELRVELLYLKLDSDPSWRSTPIASPLTSDQTAKLVAEYIATNCPELKLEFLPPYCQAKNKAEAHMHKITGLMIFFMQSAALSMRTWPLMMAAAEAAFNVTPMIGSKYPERRSKTMQENLLGHKPDLSSSSPHPAPRCSSTPTGPRRTGVPTRREWPCSSALRGLASRSCACATRSSCLRTC